MIESAVHPLLLIGDIASSIQRLTKRISAPGHWDFRRFMAVKALLDQQLLEGIDDARFPAHPQRLVSDVRKVMPDDGMIKKK